MKESDWLYVFALIGAVAALFTIIEILTRVFPAIERLRVRAFNWVALLTRVKRFQKSAEAVKIQDCINRAAFELRPYMPDNWMRKASVKWVTSPDATLIREGEIILRVQPRLNPDESLMHALWQYFCTSAFPDTLKGMPSRVRLAVALVIARTGLERVLPFLVDDFDQKFTLPQVRNGSIDKDLYADFHRLNEIGLLLGPMIREFERASRTLSIEGRAMELEQAVSTMVDHMLNFQPALRHALNDAQWSCHAAHGSYALLLVSKPPEIRPEISAYVERVRQKHGAGIERIYIIGRQKEKVFFNQVVRLILGIREIKSQGEFRLLRDYRGNPEGLCVVVGIDEILRRIDPSFRSGTEAIPLEPPEKASVVSAEPSPVLPAMDTGADHEIDSLGGLSSKILKIVDSLSNYAGEWINLAEIGGKLRADHPEFDPRKYGERNLIAVLRRMDSLAFFERQDGAGTTIFVRGAGLDEADERQREALTAVRSRVVEVLRQAAGHNWIVGTQVGGLIRREITDFTPEAYGYRLLSTFIAAIGELEVQKSESGPTWHARVR